jgi:hypothetical protein
MAKPLSQARIARMEAARLTALPHRRRILIWGRISSEIATRLEEERALYAITPTKSALIGQLLTEAITFRRAHRSPPKPVKGQPFEISLDWPKP